MKRNFKYYAICWFILLASFNVICFVTPDSMGGYSKYGGAFWAGYICITVAFIGQLVCAYIAFSAKNMQKMFYNLPLITVSYTGLILTMIAGTICMIIPDLENWVAIVVCAIILGFTAIAVIKASAAADIISEVDEKVKNKTQFIKLATIDAKNIMERAKDSKITNECKKVYEALRYSDPMSSDVLSVEEAKITVKLDELKNAVVSNDSDVVENIVSELELLIKERNNKCKELK